MSRQKSRYFTGILYPEHLSDDYLLKLESLGIPMAISPLHDKDKNKDGTYKKAHYHFIYIANNPVTSNAVRNRIKRLFGANGASMVQIINSSVKNTYLYLTHESKDAIAKKKHVYDASDIVTINAFDVDRYEAMTLENKRSYRSTLVEIIMEYRCMNIIDLKNIINLKRDEYELPSSDKLDDVIKENASFFRLHFDGNYQIYKREIEVQQKKRELNDES